MTKQEQATLDELRMTEADLEARQARVSQLLNGEATLGDQLKASIALVDKTRKKRSDAGVPKPKKPTEPVSTLSTQCARIKDLYATQQSRIAELEACRDQQADARAELEELGEREANLLGSIDGLAEQIETAWAEMLGGK